ncbi:glucose-6-phosphate isomerase [Lebetimonas natsushimae]|uniref:Glucose-6-phosphate isomerase n=1 Tax=Lebetimonas natsushimae TaxID=1936991 RepID=A0A292YDI7_9BACT|nr:glucose-6-phosphate isomerase [Lebetimonas natsushimae]GAX87451.1 glucose-6-phosphate isomerase [Lebetimonas natsushimae]
MKYELYFEYENKKAEKEAYDKVSNEYESGEIGYYHLPETSKKFKNIEFNTDYNEIVIIGIGGSSLGSKAIFEMTKNKYKTKKIIFLENPDPIDLYAKFKQITKPLFFVISKSGKTIETISIFKKVIKHFNLTKGSKNLKVITDSNSPLEKFATEWNLEIFNIPKNVGGRFSVLSAVGMIPLKAAGIDILQILEGAKNFRDRFFEKKEEHLLKKAAFYARNYKIYPINVLFAYATILNAFKEWYVQLFGESLGKNGKEIMPVGHIGSIDQHSFLQLLMEGMGHKTITFLKIDNFEINLKIPNINLPHLEVTDFVNGRTFEELINKECESTKEALLAKEYPIDEIIMDKLTLENIGELIMYYEILTSAIGGLLEINTYNQPGVEIGKTILRNKF